MGSKFYVLKVVLALTICMLLSIPAVASDISDSRSGSTIKGVVRDAEGGGDEVLEYAVVSLLDYGIVTKSGADGSYTLVGVPDGKTIIKVSYVGKLTIEEAIDVRGNMNLDFVMHTENFRIKEVVVTAQANHAGEATSSIIGRTAIDHIQATSLADVMSLLPGGLSGNQDLSSASTVSLRWGGSLGTAIIRDGAPVSNNANLSTLNPTVKGSTGTLAGGASPTEGIDLRSISTENLESVEVIRGIPSVEHGDLTSGAVIINTKAGREPLRITAKANPNVYMGSIGTGFLLGGNRGALNVNADYAHNTNKPTESYSTYRRASGRLLYSNDFGRVHSNTSLNFIYGKDQTKENPDDVSNHTKSRGEDYGINFNTNGVWKIDLGWLKSLRYIVSGSYTSKQLYMQSAHSSASSPYSGSVTDGVVLGNQAGKDIYDADGNKITNFGPADMNNAAAYLPDSYLGYNSIDSREVNAFAKVVANLFKRFGYVNNRIMIGADFKTDGNVGNGKTFDPKTPPYRELTAYDATFRPRSYKDIPFVNQFGVFAEENFQWQLGERQLKLQAGVRYDNASVVGGIVSPRFNGSFEVVPNTFIVRGGWGVTAKMPTLLYLHPENAYFEYVNINELSNENIPQEDRTLITTTKVYDAANRDLKIARNYKSEVGFDLKLGQTTIGVTAFEERMRDGYTLSYDFDSYKLFNVDRYERNDAGQFVKTGSYPVLSSFVRPGNGSLRTTRGVEFDINLGRIDVINTTFMVNGAFFDSRQHSGNYKFYDNSPREPSMRRDVAVYAPDANASTRDQRFTTSFRVVHNLPSIGFVVSLTSEVIWKDANWSRFGNDSIPVGYVSLEDGGVHMFEPGRFSTRKDVIDAGYEYMLYNPNHQNCIKESYSPYCRFNINVTKEIGEMLRVSFFANNMFRSYPRRPSKRTPGQYKSDFNNRYYFGIELALTI